MTAEIRVDRITSRTGINTLSFSDNGFSFISNTGIGTTNPTSKLTVLGNVDVTGVVTATTFVGALTGTASNVTTNANLTGDVTSTGNATAIAAGVIVDADINASAAIALSKLGTTGSINTSGIITATSFSGSGSGLTGIAATSNISTNAIVNSGITTVSAGTTALPSISPTGDSNTGVFFPSADTIAFAEGGAEAARFDSSGSLLVGTSSARSNINNYGTNTTPLVQIETAISDTNTGFSIINNTAFASTFVIGGTGSSTSGSIGQNTIVDAGRTLGGINFVGADGTNLVTAASIRAAVDGAPGTNDMPGRLVFSTTDDGAATPTERMRITNNGRVGMGENAGAEVYNATGTSGFLYGDSVGLQVCRGSNTVAYFNRRGSDGTIVSLRAQGTEEGTISVSGGTVSYNPFLGSHWSALSDWSRPDIKTGTIMETVNELVDWKYVLIETNDEQKKICYNGTTSPGGIASVEYEGQVYEGIVELETDPTFNKHVKTKVNDTAASKAVYGVFVAWNTDSNLDGGTWNDMYVGAVGNYVIRMAAGQDPEIGDLVEADGTGCAVIQDDDIIRTKTVAKITSTIPQVTYDDGSFLVTCVLYCG